MSIDRYVSTFRVRLGSPIRGDETVEEVRGHLEDAAHELQMAGFNRADSEREAVRRFGEPDEIAAAMTRARKREARRDARLAAVLVAATLLLLGGNAVAFANTHTSHAYRPATAGAPRAPITSSRGPASP